MTKMLNRQRVLARLAKVPAVIQEAAGRQLKIEVDDMVAAMKRAAPVDPNSKNPGNLRDKFRCLCRCCLRILIRRSRIPIAGG